VEAYVDGIMVCSCKEEDLLADLRESFRNLKPWGCASTWKSAPSMCAHRNIKSCFMQHEEELRNTQRQHLKTIRNIKI
jgi:hypothetical protein